MGARKNCGSKISESLRIDKSKSKDSQKTKLSV